MLRSLSGTTLWLTPCFLPSTILLLSLTTTYRLILLPSHYLLPTEWRWRPGGNDKSTIGITVSLRHLSCVYSEALEPLAIEQSSHDWLTWLLVRLTIRDAYNQRNCNQPINFDYYKTTAPDYNWLYWLCTNFLIRIRLILAWERLYESYLLLNSLIHLLPCLPPYCSPCSCPHRRSLLSIDASRLIALPATSTVAKPPDFDDLSKPAF